MKWSICAFLFVLVMLSNGKAQHRHHWLVKTNLTNLVMGRPALAFEWQTGNKGIQLSYAGGEAAPFLTLDRYAYQGLTADMRWYSPSNARFRWFYGPYLGYLRREISATKVYLPPFIVVGKDTEFKGDAVRMGGLVGSQLQMRNGIHVEIRYAMGGGFYIHQEDDLPNPHRKGFLDLQPWLAIGYTF